MGHTEVQKRGGVSRVLVAGLFLVVVALGGWGLFQLGLQPAETAGPQAAFDPGKAETAAPAVAASVPAPGAAAASGPSPRFDVVRVGPGGEAVIAGRAEPGAQVIVRDGAQEIARVEADRRGAFVAVPGQALAAGGRSLTLAARGPDSTEVAGDGSVVVVVPPRPTGQDRAGSGGQTPGSMAVLVPNAGAPRVLQGERPGSGVGLDSVEYDDAGAIRFAGRAPDGSTVRVYVDNQKLGDAAVEGGRWMLAPTAEMTAGVHRLRADQVDQAGRVLARVEVPFQRTTMTAGELAGGRVVVQPGQNLWRMARSAYGSGVRYTVIYLANREQIRDPRLIYPGQAISIPGAAR